jgi:23S rRNA (uracil1939-C5)-methyltransferase
VPFELVPQKLVYGGKALGYSQGRTVLVPYALPGERLEVETIRQAKGVMHARALRVLAPAAERVEAPCPYYGRCGGCHYQHQRVELQAAAKREILRDALRRIGKITWDDEMPIHTGPPWNYRNHAQLQVGYSPGGHVALGFFEAESHRLCPVDACLILSPRLNLILAELRRGHWLSRLAGCTGIDLRADDRDESVMVTVHGDGSESLASDLLNEIAGVVTVAVESGGNLRVFGKVGLEYCVGDFRYRISPGSFFQASRYLLPQLVSAVVKGESGARALDLFAGVGLLTLPLAGHFDRVVGVEAVSPAVLDLRANAAANLLPNIQPVHASAFDFLRRYAGSAPDLVVLDPPRAGLDPRTLQALAGLRPKRIHYLSCSPPTQARDLAYLWRREYQIHSIEMFDLFPQTYHIESLARLVQKDSARA